MSKCTSAVLVQVYECCKCPSVGVQCLYECTSVVSDKVYECSACISVRVL